MRWLPLLLVLGCDVEGPYDPESPWTEGQLGVWRPGLTVAEAGGCSTAIVAGLSRQLIAEVNCLRPNTLTDFSGAGIVAGGAVWPLLQPGGARSLRAAVAARGRNLQVNSALRTLAQQYLLYRWSQAGQCGIGLAARPGRSNHESGLAVDIEDNAGWRPSMEAQSFRWFGADDAVHFDYRGGGTVELSGLSILAFQRLWNRNHQGDLIDEDGDYGPQTEARLRASPTDGFAVGACVVEPPPMDAAPPPPPPPPPVDAAPPSDPVADAALPEVDAQLPVDAGEPLDGGEDAATEPTQPGVDAEVRPMEELDFASDFAFERRDLGQGVRLVGTSGCGAAPGRGSPLGWWILLAVGAAFQRRRRR